jgi:hypothetical protein
LSDAEANQALEVLLKQIGQADGYWALWPLTEALQSLIGKLSDTQSATALELMLSRIGQTMNLPERQGFDNVFHARPLADLCQILANKLSKVGAEHALEPLLTQIGVARHDGWPASDTRMAGRCASVRWPDGLEATRDFCRARRR